MSNFLQSMKESEPGPNDKIAATTLNVTKFGAVFAALVPIVLAFFDATGIEVSGSEVKLTSGQWLLTIFGALGFIVILMITDMVVRGYVTAHSSVHTYPVTPTNAVVYTHGVPHQAGNVADLGVVEAFTVDDNGTAKVLVTRGHTTEWIPFEDVDLRGPAGIR